MILLKVGVAYTKSMGEEELLILELGGSEDNFL
jgi:hypothetical protein